MAIPVLLVIIAIFYDTLLDIAIGPLVLPISLGMVSRCHTVLDAQHLENPMVELKTHSDMQTALKEILQYYLITVIKCYTSLQAKTGR